MGRDKSRLRLGGRTLMGWVRAAAWSLELPVRVIRKDTQPGLGPLGGIYTALSSSQAAGVLFLSCDMPFVTPALLRRVLERSHPNRAVFVSMRGTVGFPFWMGRGLHPVIQAEMGAGNLSLQRLARTLEAEILEQPDDGQELFNINTPADWEEARRRVAGMSI